MTDMFSLTLIQGNSSNVWVKWRWFFVQFFIKFRQYWLKFKQFELEFTFFKLQWIQRNKKRKFCNLHFSEIYSNLFNLQTLSNGINHVIKADGTVHHLFRDTERMCHKRFLKEVCESICSRKNIQLLRLSLMNYYLREVSNLYLLCYD